MPSYYVMGLMFYGYLMSYIYMDAIRDLTKFFDTISLVNVKVYILWCASQHSVFWVKSSHFSF